MEMRSPIGAVVRRLGVVGARGQRRDVVGRLRLEVEDDKPVGDEVVNRVEALVADEVLTVVVQAEVLRRCFKPVQCRMLSSTSSCTDAYMIFKTDTNNAPNRDGE